MTNPSSEWRWADPTGQQRLVREDELRAALVAGTIPSNAPVWRPGWKQWKPASDVEELKASADDGVPPPPMFVVVAQKQFEGKPVAGEEPPPPPRYVPAKANTPPRVIPPADASGPTIVDPMPPVMEASKSAAGSGTARAPVPAAGTAPRPRAPTVSFGGTPAAPKVAPRTAAAPSPPIPKKPQATPPAVPKRPTSKPPPLPKKAKSAAPPPLPEAKRSATTTQVPPPYGPAAPPPSGPMAPPPPAPVAKKSIPPPLPARAKSAPPAPSGRTTLPVAPAPPPMPKIEPVYAGPSEPAPDASVPASKFPTLMMFGEEPQPPPATKPADEAPPIVVPPPEPSNVTNAVTRPPPWGDGTVGIADNIPKAPTSPMFPATTIEDRPSDVGRNMELSSSDLTSDARLEVVKPAPLVAAERPRTVMGIGPETVAKKEPPPAEPTEPMLPEPAADTSPHLSAPAPSGSGDKIQDLREIARKRLSEAGVVARKGMTEAGSLAKRAYAEARERTKDKPSWFLPAAFGGALVALVATVALVVHAASGSASSSSASASVSASSSGAPLAATESSTAKAASTAAAEAARPVVCALSGSPRTVAPKALVPSGVEVTALGSQIALGFATGPKEGVLELLDPSSVASASSLHLRSNEPIRRVLVYGDDKPQAALDADKKTDALQGRRTLRANPPIDVGAMDGGLVWAPHGTDKGIKLWSLASGDPIQALRGEPLPDAKGFVVAFRQSGAIFVGTFGGNPPAPLGPLLRADGLGPQVGSPAVAASGDRVMVAWADRAGTADPWGLRYAVTRIGEDAIHPQSFTLPPGGLGEQGMSPGLSPLPGSAFLLLWTEGQVSDHQVRGAVFEGGAARDVFTASAEGVNAGQPQGAVLPDGRGAVAFLASNGKSFEVVATPIHCTEK